jgi:hypothetical protein
MLQYVVLALLQLLFFIAGACYFKIRAKPHLSSLSHQQEEEESDKNVDGLVDICINWFVQVLVGDEVHDLRPLDLLAFFWENHPATPCIECQEPFNEVDGPPIRTLALEKRDCKQTICTIRVRNRHLKCCKNYSSSLFPVSHVWHQEISRAHHEKEINFDAQLAVFQTILRVLNGADSTFGELHDVLEIWHDYVSVPQWSHTIQQQLLLSIPGIFSLAETILVHLDDVSLETVANMFLGKVGEVENLRATGNFFQARWFRRMWTILEFANCNEASILTEEGIVVYKLGAGGTLPNSFTFMWATGWFQFFEKIANHLNDKTGALDGIRFPDVEQMYIKQIRPRIRTGNTLGEVIGIIGSKECSVYRDRFIAICALLELENYVDISLQVPSSDLEACRWVMWECLKRGDYSPLLLTPNGESEVPGCSWMKAHEKMDQDTWCLGQASSPPDCPTIVRDGHLKPELMSVGIIEEVHFWEFTSEKLASLRNVVDLILKTHGRSASQFVSTISRVYGIPEHMRALKCPKTLDEAVQRIPDFEARLNKLFDEILGIAPFRNSYIEICKLMGLLEPLQMGKQGTAMHHSEISIFDQNEHTFLTVAVVQCRGCEQRFLFQLILYTKDAIGSEVYRIPGIKFSCSVKEGVGLVISQKKLVGCMIFGVPACDCNIREHVLIE